MDDTILKNIQLTIGHIKVNVKNIADKIIIRNITITQAQTSSAMEKKYVQVVQWKKDVNKIIKWKILSYS